MKKNPYLAKVLQNISTKGDSIFSRFMCRGSETIVTWNSLGRLSQYYCKKLRELEAPQGSVVLIFLKHSTSLYGTFLGAMLAGVIPSFMPCLSLKQDPKIYWKSHINLFETIKPLAIIATQETVVEMIENGIDVSKIHIILALDELSLAQEVELSINAKKTHLQSIAFLQHSSGTTGLKKGVMLSYDSVLNQVVSYSDSISLSNQDSIISWLPLYHDMGLITGFIIPLYIGSGIIHIDPFSWVAKPTILLEYITQYRPSFCWMPNFAFKHLASFSVPLDEVYDLSSIRAFINCSEVCTPNAFDEFYDAFKENNLNLKSLQCCYAMAETVYAVTQTDLNNVPARIRIDDNNAKIGKYIIASDNSNLTREIIEVGSVISGASINAYDDQLNKLGFGFVGEIGVEADFLFNGYNHLPDLTAQKIRNNIYYTGDIGFIWHNSLYILGRKDDLIVINGRNIYAAEVEQIISTVEGLKPGRSIAIGYFYEKIGSMVLVIVAEKSMGPVNEENIKQQIMKLLHSLLNVTPREIFLVEEGWLIKTTSGKISRKENSLKLMKLLA